MKIIQIIPAFGVAGAEIMCENLSCALKSLGHEVVVVSLYDFYSPITERLEKANTDLRYLGKKSGLDFHVVKKLRKILKEERPDAIHTHLYAFKYAVLAARGTNCRIIHTVHTLAEKESGPLDRALGQIFFKKPNIVPVALSGFIQTTIASQYKLEKSKIPVIFNGIDLSKCWPKQDYACRDALKILHIGRFTELKNHIGLVRAFERFHARYPNSRLQLVGDGETKGDIQRYVQDHNLSDSVDFLGLQADVYGFLHEADIFTLPSLYEGVPMTLIEAMGTGLPIVATAVGGVPDMLQNGVNALLIDPDPEAICDALFAYTKDAGLRKRHGENAKSRALLFSSQAMAQNYLEVYQH